MNLQYVNSRLSKSTWLKIVKHKAVKIGVMLTYLMLTKEIEAKRNGLKPLKMSLSPKSRNIITKLSGLFAIDSFAGGFVLQSIVSLWFFTKFGADFITLSYVFSIAEYLPPSLSSWWQRSQTELAWLILW